MRAEVNRLHGSILPTSMAASAVMGVCIGLLLWDSGAHQRLFWWLAGLVLVLVVRLAIGWRQCRAVAERQPEVNWLLWHRCGYAVHGLVWGMAGLLFSPVLDQTVFNVLVFAVVAMGAGALIWTAFDVVAALAFAVPAVAPLVVQLLDRRDGPMAGWWIVALLLLSAALMSAPRTQRMVREAVRLRLAGQEHVEHALRSAEAAEQARCELAQTNVLLPLLLEHTQQGFWAIDNAGCTTNVNPAMCGLLGRTRDDIIGRSVFDFLQGPDLQLMREQLQARQHGATAGYEISLVRPDGTRRYCYNNATPLLDARGNKLGSVGLWTDITAQQRALTIVTDMEAQQRALIEAFPGFIARLDDRLVYTHVNERLARRLGLSPGDMVGRSVAEVFGPQREAELRPLITRVLAGESASYERQHLAGESGGSIDQVTLATGVDPRSGRPVIYSFGIDITARKQAEEQLRIASEQLVRKTHELQLTLDNIGQGIVSMDADGRVEVYNRRVLELLDLPESLLGPMSSYDDVVRYQAAQGDLAPDHSFFDIDGRHRYFQGGRANAPEVYVRRLKSKRAVEVRTRQMPGGGLVRTFADVTDYVDAQQALRDGEAELRSLLAAFPGYITAINQDLVYTYINDRFASVLGISPDDYLGKAVGDVLGDEAAAYSRLQAQKVREFGPQVCVRVYAASEHHPLLELEVTSVAGAARGNTGQTYYAFGQDVTARRAVEQELIASRDTAESASRAKSEFLASMSHELRTPLNAILGFSELFRLDQSLPAPTREGAAEIERAGKHLLALVDDVIDLARIEAGRLDLSLEPVDVGVVVAQCVALVEPLARKRGVVVRFDIEPLEPVSTDRLRMRQVVLNLLSNAIKYNRDRGSVQVYLARRQSDLYLSVADTGAGIALPLQPRVFTSFDRLGAERGQVEGAGIGLVITKRIVEAMGGSIGFESREGIGSAFWMRIPITRGNAHAPGGDVAKALL